ncbi:MAG: hypothetical protein GTO00_10685 [Deltaproteobacteria bacterium]|nr:hypothetical protein [Deltaproteobacteria bacterium]
MGGGFFPFCMTDRHCRFDSRGGRKQPSFGRRFFVLSSIAGDVGKYNCDGREEVRRCLTG